MIIKNAFRPGLICAVVVGLGVHFIASVVTMVSQKDLVDCGDAALQRRQFPLWVAPL